MLTVAGAKLVVKNDTTWLPSALWMINEAVIYLNFYGERFVKARPLV
jgi:hypothetical protein